MLTRTIIQFRIYYESITKLTFIKHIEVRIMFRSKKSGSILVFMLVLLALLAFPMAVHADEDNSPALTEEGNPILNLPGKDIVSPGTEEAVVPASDSSNTAGSSTANYPASSYPTSSYPATAAHPDTIPYLFILLLAGIAALIYRQVMIVNNRNASREEHEEEMKAFRMECEAARTSR